MPPEALRPLLTLPGACTGLRVDDGVAARVVHVSAPMQHHAIHLQALVSDHNVQTSVVVSLAMTTPLMFLTDLLLRVILTIVVTVTTSLIVGAINRRMNPTLPAAPPAPALPAQTPATPDTTGRTSRISDVKLPREGTHDE